MKKNKTKNNLDELRNFQITNTNIEQKNAPKLTPTICSSLTGSFMWNKTKYEFFGISVNGHGKLNQDSIFTSKYGKNGIFFGVADGLGSASNSKKGSNDILNEASKDLNLKDGFNKFCEKWKSSHDSSHDTTINFCVINQDGFFVDGIGDGMIVFSRKDEITSLKTSTQKFTNITESVFSFDWTNYKKPIVIKNKPFNVLILATDGISEDINDIKGFVDEIKSESNFSSLKKKISDIVLDWPVKTNGDDKSILIVRRKK